MFHSKLVHHVSFLEPLQQLVIGYWAVEQGSALLYSPCTKSSVSPKVIESSLLDRSFHSFKSWWKMIWDSSSLLEGSCHDLIWWQELFAIQSEIVPSILCITRSSEANLQIGNIGCYSIFGGIRANPGEFFLNPSAMAQLCEEGAVLHGAWSTLPWTITDCSTHSLFSKEID